MNIAIVGKFYTEGFGLHIEEGLIEMGHKVLRVDPEINIGGYLMPEKVRSISKTLYQQIFHKIGAVRRFKSKEIYELIKNKPVDLTVVLHDFLTKEEVTEIKRLTKSPVVLWFPDHIANIQKAMFFVAGYDFLFFKDHYMVDRFRNEYSLNTYYLPQCCNPKRHNLITISAEEKKYYECEITNAGNLYPSRAILYSKLAGYHFKMWGSPPAVWLNLQELKPIYMNKAVYNADKCKAFSSAKIVLNNMHPAEINGVNKRTFEVSACGGFQITNNNPALGEFYEVDKEVVTYDTLEELIEKVDYFLKPENEQERSSIVLAGHKRSTEEHTYVNRMSKMINVIFN